MSLDLTGVRAKLTRSQEHAQSITNEILTWHGRYPYSVVENLNPERTRFSIFVRINEPPPFQRLALMFGDYLNNIRSALDHLIYAVAAYESAPDPPRFANKLMFPITAGRCEFDEVIAKRNLLGDISDPVRAEIERLQPYNRPNPKLGTPALRLLASLNNSDKHRLLSVVAGKAINGNMGFARESGLPIPGNWVPAISPSGEVHDGAEIFALVGDTPAPSDMKFDRVIVDVIVSVMETQGTVFSSPAPFELPLVLDEISREARKIIYQVSGRIA